MGIFGKKKDEETTLREFEKVVMNELIKPAEYSYKTTKYKRDINQLDLLKDWFTDITNLINNKVASREYSAIKEIDVDLKNYINKTIVPTLHRKGYKTYIINKGTEIKHADGSVDKIDTDATFIIVTWNSPVLSDGTTTETNIVDKDFQKSVNVDNLLNQELTRTDSENNESSIAS